jgi:hypothetical protein
MSRYPSKVIVSGPPAASALRRLASDGLSGQLPSKIETASLDHLLGAADVERVLPYVYQAAREGRIQDSTGEWLEEVRVRTMAAAAFTLAAHAAAMQLIQRLDEIGVGDALILKGCATAHLDYERPADRFSSDVDFLVPGTAIGDVIDGFRQLERAPERSLNWSRRFGHAVTLKGLNEVELDVHARIAQAYVGLSIPPDELRETAVPFEIGGVSMRALDGPNRLIHAAVHSRSVNIGLHSKRDVPQLVLVSEVDWEEAIRRAERWQIDYFFALGVINAWSAFELPTHPLVEWAEGYDRPAGRRQRLAAQLAGSRLRGNVIAAPLALPIREWPAYVGPLLFPSKAYVQANNKGWRTRLRIFTGEVRNR